jgi:hypothetical protein
MGIKSKSPDVRYLTYFLIFPGDNDYWVDQTPFIHDLQFELKNWHGINKNHKRVRDILTKGETHWQDHNGVTHRLIIEEKQRARKWGTGKPRLN